MKFAILVYESETDFMERYDPEKGEAYRGAHMAYVQVLKDAGVWVGQGAGLEPPTSHTATIRMVNDKRVIQDGPYAEGKEQLGGFALIEAPDLKTAVEWASKCPAAKRAGVEVRPVLGM